MTKDPSGSTPQLRGRSWPRTLLATVGAAVVFGGAVVACGSSSSASSNAPAPVAQTGSSAASGPDSGGGTGQGGIRPAAQGLIAEVDSGSMEVQSATAQSTVTWTSSTTFTQTSKATIANAKVGSCVSAFAVGNAAAGTSGAAGAGPAPTTAPTATRTAPTGRSGQPPVQQKVTAMTATTVLISPAVNGQCTGAAGFGGFAGGFGGVRPTGVRPTGTGAPTAAGRPGAAGFAGRGGDRVSGKVTKVTGSVLTVAVTDRSDKTSYDSAVTVTASTAFTQTQSVKASAVKVGLCATAIGTADTTGTVAAKTVALTEATNGSCTVGFGGGNGARGNRAGNGGGAGGTAETTNG